jgi:hypothetical protein
MSFEPNNGLSVRMGIYNYPRELAGSGVTWASIRKQTRPPPTGP